MQSRRGISVKPLAAALTIALAATSTGANAGTQSNSAFSAQMQAFKNAVAQARQDYAQHPQQFKFLQKAPAHSVKFAKRHSQKIAAPAATVSVTSCVDNASSATTAGTLRYAVLNAVNGDVIDLSACNNSTITLTQGALPVTVDDLSISAGAGNRVTIDGNATDRVFYLTGPGTGTNNFLALSYLTIQNGNAPLLTPPPPPGTNAPADSITVAAGGCILSMQDGIALYNSTVTGCRAVNAGGVAEGGGILSYGGLYMYASTLSNNVVSSVKSGSSTTYKYGAVGGGAITQGPAYLYSSHVDGNSVTVSGGGQIADAGGLFSLSPAKVYYSTIANNSVQMNAGTIGSGPYVAIGGGLSVKYGANLLASTISGNRVACPGANLSSLNAFCLAGGIIDAYSPSTDGAVLSIAYSTVSGNHSDFLGGGVVSKYELNMTQSTISGNSALGGGGLVQKYFSGGSATVYNSTVAANIATYVGGGIFSYTSGPITPSSSTPAPITLVSSIVAKNTANGAPGDIYLESGSTLTITGSNDLVMAATPNITLPGGTLNTDPKLAPLANNGGPTRTRGLLAGSPALGMGINPNGYTNDQRGTGFPRTVAGLTDIGAFQGTVAAAAATRIPAPALSTWALGLLAGLLGLIGWRRHRIE
jgi:hypothetical protein